MESKETTGTCALCGKENAHGVTTMYNGKEAMNAENFISIGYILPKETK